MDHVAKEIVESVQVLGVAALRMSKDETRNFLLMLESRFCNQLGGSKPLWERIEGGNSLQDVDAWKHVDILCGDGPVVMVVEGRDYSAFHFEKAIDVVAVLNDTFGFVFYLSDPAASYVVAYNDHDVLISAGDAADRLERIQNLRPQ